MTGGANTHLGMLELCCYIIDDYLDISKLGCYENIANTSFPREIIQ